MKIKKVRINIARGYVSAGFRLYGFIVSLPSRQVFIGIKAPAHRWHRAANHKGKHQ